MSCARGRCPRTSGPTTLFRDLIKIDIEGGEFEVLQGAEVVLREASPVLIVAMHPDPLEKMGSSPARLIAFLDRFGYSTRHLDGTPVRDDVGFEEIIFEKRP